MDTFVAAKRVADRHAATGLRRALAGCWTMEATTATCAARDAHATPAAGRQRALTDARHFGDRVRIEGAASGLHLVAWIPGLPAGAEAALVQAARSLACASIQ